MPNKEEGETKKLRKEYGVAPQSPISNENLTVFIDPLIRDKETIQEFQKDYNTNSVFPIRVDSSTLRGDEWATVLSTGGTTDEVYIRSLFNIITKLQSGKTSHKTAINVESLKDQVLSSSLLSQKQRNLALLRLDLLESLLASQREDFVSKLALGGINIFDFRGKGKATRHPDDMLSIITLVLSVLHSRKDCLDKPFVFVISEAHEYFKNGMSKTFISQIHKMIRRRRHVGNWLLLDTQLPSDVDENVIKLADVKIVHSLDKGEESRLLKRAFGETADKFSELKTGEAYIMGNKSSKGPNLPFSVRIRPRLTHHGAPTKKLVK